MPLRASDPEVLVGSRPNPAAFSPSCAYSFELHSRSATPIVLLAPDRRAFDFPIPATQRSTIEIAQRDFAVFERELGELISGELMAVEEALAAAGAQWTPGARVIPPGER